MLSSGCLFARHRTILSVSDGNTENWNFTECGSNQHIIRISRHHELVGALLTQVNGIFALQLNRHTYIGSGVAKDRSLSLSRIDGGLCCNITLGNLEA